MTFSEYAQMLNPYLGEGMSSAEFIAFLTTQIMDNTFTDSDADLKNHPLAKKKDNTLASIYNGNRPLSRKDAQVILSHLDKSRFQEYLSELSVDTLDLIRNAMLENGITIDENEIDTCTDLCVSILQDCASRKPKSSKNVPTLDGTKNEAVSQSPSPSYEPESECMSDNCLVEKESSKSTLSPLEEPPASVADGDATPVSDKSGDTPSNTEVPVTLDKMVLPDISNEQEPFVPAADHENESNDQEAIGTETQPERMVDVFDQSYNDYAVEGFIDSNPTTDRIHDMIHFIGHIREQDKMDCLDKNEEIYQGIVSFVDILQEYLSFLKRSSGNLDFFPDNYTPPNSDNKEFSEELNRYREQLKSLYLPIKVEVEKQRDEKDEQRRAAGKEALDKSNRKSTRISPL